MDISRLKSNLRPLLFLVGIAFFILLIAQSREETEIILATINWSFFLLSALIAVGDNILISLLFQTLLQKYGFLLDYPRIGEMYFFGQMAKYIPGRFWSILYHATFLDGPGATKATFLANLDLTAVMLWRNLAIAAALLASYFNAGVAFVFVILGIFVFALLCRCCWLTYIGGRVIRLFKKAELESFCHCSPKTFLICTVSLFTWIAFLAANILLMQAALGYDAEVAIFYIAYFGLAWVVGVISFIVPAGIGVREVTFIFLAQTFGQDGNDTNVATLAAIAIVYRFWQVSHEVGGLVVGFVLNCYRRRLARVGTGL